jgi:hypothetical protein
MFRARPLRAARGCGRLGMTTVDWVPHQGTTLRFTLASETARGDSPGRSLLRVCSKAELRSYLESAG